MTRCKLCDWSPGSGQSLYHTSLVQKRGRERKLIEVNGEKLCTVCLEK